MSEQREPNESRNRSLGLVELPDNTYEHDLAVSNKYQNFSAEVLRLSLLGIAAVGFLVTNTVFKASPSGQVNQQSVRLPAEFRTLISLSLICLGLSVGSALLHSFYSADTIAWHLSVIRRELRNADGEATEMEKERKRRRSCIRWEFRFKVASGILLWLGASLLAVSFIALL